jgi:Zn-dependent peptidase ImmA (M78 family)
MHITVKPELLRWARERAGFTTEKVYKHFPKFIEWENGVLKPTLKQLEHFAQFAHVPFGYLFLQEPPVEQVPIPDFRTPGSIYLNRASPDLLETIYICQQRQEWYHEYAMLLREDPYSFVGSAKLNDSIISVAANIRHMLGFEIEERHNMHTWEEALRQFISQIDDLGVLVMINSVVGSNNHRKLDQSEFRGFTLSDDLAPLIFINGADTKSGQMFTLAHELAHLWLGETGISDIEPISSPINRIEIWCNQVAAEILVPLTIFKNVYDETIDLNIEMDRLARYFKVSTLVILRRIYDAGYLMQDELWEIYDKELKRLRAMPRGRGGDFYRAQRVRVSNRFAKALIANTLEGQTLHRDAFRLLGFAKHSTFLQLGRNLGIVKDYYSGISS